MADLSRNQLVFGAVDITRQRDLHMFTQQKQQYRKPDALYALFL
jgi:hypothetical protein